ncbi:MAG: hypothetical protein MHM6MM_004354 [Cercozoa sp. M6MM]
MFGRISRRLALASASAAAAVGATQVFESTEETRSFADRSFVDACGIVGYVSDNESQETVDVLLEGLTILQNRGYDSAGIATLRRSPSEASASDGEEFELRTCKYASRGSTSDSIDLLKRHAPTIHGDSHIGIAHTRWATHGGKTDDNAHPHCDEDQRIALVHNGTIENSQEWRKRLMEKGVKFSSETDTEVIAQMVGHFMKTMDCDALSALRHTLSLLSGTWGIVMLDKQQPDQLIVARNGSPLMVGLGQNGRMFVASEHTAFSRYTKEYIALNDGEIAVVSTRALSLDLKRVEKAPDEQIELSPAPYPHWTVKEIFEQPLAIARALGFGGRLMNGNRVKLGGLESNAETLLKIKNLLIAGCGTSKFAAEYGARLMRHLRSFDSVSVCDAAEVDADTFPRKDAGLLAISQSGETKDTHRAVVTGGQLHVPRFSIVNSVGSLIARTTRCGVYLHAGREQAVASTKAFTTQVTVLALIAAWFAQQRIEQDQSRDTLLEAIYSLPTYAGMTLRAQQQCAKVAERIADKEHLFVLGKGFAEPIASEGALKIKEITYMHAEGYSGGALKHGPFALIEQGTPVIMLILDDKHAHFMRTAAEEVRARGAHVIVITDKRELAQGIADDEDVLDIPSNGPLTALLGVIPLQLLAYELAVRRGNDPDKPKNLAKAVTVD